MPPDLPLQLYYYMRLTRSLEERLVLLKHQGRLACGVYRSLGQEACAVGSAMALGPGDVVGPMIRNLGSILVRGATPREVLCQMLGNAESPTHGRELGFHFSDLARGFIGHVAVLGDMVPVLAGVALSFRLRGEPRVALVHSGDGTTSTGTFHEGLNFAAVQRLPLVLVVEHNYYAYSTPSERQFAVQDLAERATAYGVPALKADGNDAQAVHEVTCRAVAAARAGQGVTMIVLETYRRCGHALHDDQRYVPAGEIDDWAGRDPLDRQRQRLLHDGASAEDVRAIDARIGREIDEAVAAALELAPADPRLALSGVTTRAP